MQGGSSWGFWVSNKQADEDQDPIPGGKLNVDPFSGHRRCE